MSERQTTVQLLGRALDIIDGLCTVMEEHGLDLETSEARSQLSALHLEYAIRLEGITNGATF